MLKAIIIDDEIDGAELLQHLIKDNCPDVFVIAAETSPAKGIELIEKYKPDVVFLDIEMPGMSGFEVLEQLKHLSFHVIFTTAYDNYAIKAFRYSALDYLLKPIIVSQLVTAIDKLIEKNKNNQEKVNVNKLLEIIRNPQIQSRLAINGLDEIRYVDVNCIVRLESDSNYTKIILSDGKKITASKTLKDYEVTLSAHSFFRSHKTHIINLNHIEKYVKSEGGYIVMKDGHQIPVSRDKRQKLIEILSSTL